MTNPNIEFVTSLVVGAVLLLASYRVNSWCLFSIGAAFLLLTVVANNIAALPSRQKNRE